jgi:hypothetical protein
MSERIGADYGAGGGVQPVQVVRITVRLAQAGQARAGVDLDHGPEGQRLVDANLV